MAVTAVLLASAALGAWMSSAWRSPDPLPAPPSPSAGSLEVSGLAQPVRIDRDRHGVPHIDAASEADAFFGLGFCHAQDRLGQLLHLRRQARGTAAEVLGPQAVAADRLARLIDFPGLAERQWAKLPRHARRALEAYAEGVNARIARIGRDAAAGPNAPAAPAIEPWRPQDSLALFKLFAWGMSASIDASLVLNELVGEIGAADAARFFPPRAVRRPAPAARKTAAAPWVYDGSLALRGAFGLAGHGVGSTAFVVGGRHTESGHPVLVADSHFQPTAPPALYLAHIRSPAGDIAGATPAGVPVFWWGRNAKLAWAAVNAGLVVTDLYTETLRKDGSEYHDGRRWRPVEERTEVIHVRGGADETLVVRRTTHGSILPPAEGTSEAISVAWTGARIDGPSGIASLLSVAHAADGAAVREALREHREPPIALAWAEAAGGAGLQVAGWVPHRRLAAQLLPLPGRARWYDWQEPVAFEALASERLEDGKGFLVASDQAFESADGEDPIDATWRTGARTSRLRTLVSGSLDRSADLRHWVSLLSDDHLVRSVAIAKLALSLAGDDLRAQEASELARLLREWDGRASSDSVGATAYHVFLHALAEELFAKRLGEDRFQRYLALPALDLESLVQGVLTDAAEGGVDDVWSDPETVRAAVRKSLREAWLGLSFDRGADPRRWVWGRMHRLRFRTPGGERPLGPFPYGGAPHAVLAAAYSLADPFAVQVAPTARFGVDTGTLDIALTALAPGQSERPDDPAYRAGLDGWLVGRHALLATRRLEVEDLSVGRLVLEPVR